MPKNQPADPSFLASVLRLWLRSGLRGGNRTARLLARRIKSLQTVPIQISDLPPVYMDLRNWDAHDWLSGSPWTVSPQEEEEQWILQRFVLPGDVVYDIGANIGMHTALFSSLVGSAGHVYAFEPNPNLQPGLLRTIGGMKNGTFFPVALSDQAGQAQLFVTEEDHSCQGKVEMGSSALLVQGAHDEFRLAEFVRTGEGSTRARR